MKVPRLFSETWTQTSKLAGEEGLSLCEARVCAGVKQNNSDEGLPLTCECNGGCSKGNSNFLYPCICKSFVQQDECFVF